MFECVYSFFLFVAFAALVSYVGRSKVVIIDKRFRAPELHSFNVEKIKPAAVSDYYDFERIVFQYKKAFSKYENTFRPNNYNLYFAALLLFFYRVFACAFALDGTPWVFCIVIAVAVAGLVVGWFIIKNIVNDPVLYRECEYADDVIQITKKEDCKNETEYLYKEIERSKKILERRTEVFVEHAYIEALGVDDKRAVIAAFAFDAVVLLLPLVFKFQNLID